MPNSQAITKFQIACQKYYTCYAIAVMAMKEYGDRFSSFQPDRNKTLFLGKGHPSEGNWQASINIGDFIDYSERDGVFSDKIAKSFITAMYSEWDELYRKELAVEEGVKHSDVQCDLMGDLRLIRHTIVHNKSLVSDEHTKIKVLKWQLSPGELKITDEMFTTLIDQINRMQVRVRVVPD